MVAAFSFGPLGAMADLVVAPAVSPAVEGQLAAFVAPAARYYQYPLTSPRSWTITRPWQDPAFARVLGLAAHGLGGPYMLYDRACARQNMIPRTLAVGAGAPVVVAGLSLGAVTWTSIQVPILADRAYTVSAWTPQAGPGAFTVAPADGAALSAPAPVGGVAAVQIPARSTPTTLTITRVGPALSGVRVHEGTPDGLFYATQGTPCRVAVEAPEQTYQLVTDTQTRIDYQVTLHETGRTGYYT